MKSKQYIYVGVAVLLFIIGYLLGRSSVDIPAPETIVEVRWEKGDTVTDTIYVPKPYKVIERDTVEVPKFIPTDTAKLHEVWQDYYLKRYYVLDFSNDTLGTFKVDTEITENKLILATSFIEPYIKTVSETKTIYRVPTIQFFGIIGSSLDMKTNKVQFGVDLKQKYIIGASGIRVDNQGYYTIDLGIKF